MISCEHAQNLFEAYLNDEVPASLVAELDAHCLSCTLCRQQLSLMEACGNVVRLDTSEPAVSEDFTDRLVAILEADRPRRSGLQLARRMKLVGGLLGAAAAVALFVILQPNKPELAPRVMGIHTDSAVSVPGSIVRDFIGLPVPLLQVPESLSAVLELSGLTLNKLNDAAASETRPAIESVPVSPQPAHEGPDVLETLPPDGGELM